MKKISKLLVAIVILSACKNQTIEVDYFGQPEPSTTPLLFAEGIISNKNRFEHGISFSPDNQELAFGILDANSSKGTIYHSEKSNGSWAKPENFAPLQNKSVYLPYFTPDGKALLFAQSIPDTSRLYITDIWKLDRTNGDWGVPKKMQNPLSSDSREASASKSLKGNLYFSSNRNCEGKENCYTADLFSSELIDNSYRDATAITRVNSESDEESIFISPQEDYLIFCRYTDNTTWMDLYISYRDANNQWTTPQRVDASINSKDWDRRPYVSMDNKFLFFTRLQIEETGLKESDIYWVKTSKLFKPFVYRPVSSFTVKTGEPFEIYLPPDLFNDIDGDNLEVTLETQLGGVTFDADEMKLLGTANFEDSHLITLTATDSFSNKVKHQITLVANK